MQNKNPQQPRRKYDSSFKAEVVSRIATGRSLPDVDRSLGIGENIIYRWRREALGSTEPTTTFPTTAAPLQVSLSEHLALQKRLRSAANSLKQSNRIISGQATL